ncbi:Leucine aminopeptidase 2, chloroplastic [Tetrabaena socialis]|uniref:Leucine aminopeptidase 2, chloroplastic n=1 Tax=Tetrabaena socialis TaxID=47790 RepID=A0A2J7ZPX9_9CHLO|nr:Leucine aminopeptidase 2, chloroplastic [Tetrabaena socialis]|eukprot:PNH02316.1 Leucine aminopeptidase 2, chloroplastic [Tetrabaena socialis]
MCRQALLARSARATAQLLASSSSRSVIVPCAAALRARPAPFTGHCPARMLSSAARGSVLTAATSSWKEVSFEADVLPAVAPADVEVHFVVASCENMVAGVGLRPGDILTGASGKTVEVNNTDAEGRLTLADAMWFAQEKCGATAMVDIATLTGSCIVALGSDIAGVFTPSDAMAASISAASKTAGEKVWRMPWETDYFESMKSPVADMKNTGSRNGGAISAALFLEQFVNKGVEWAHVDMAGPVWNDKAGLPTGWGAAMLAEWVVAQAAKK